MADVPLPPAGTRGPGAGTRGPGKHQSAVLRKARDAFDAGKHATLDEAVDAFYAEYRTRKPSDEKTVADVDRRIKAKQRMRNALQEMGPNLSDEGT